jgi:sugar/nucleoside kinase (ribokinase family)
VGRENDKKILFSIPSFAKNVLDAVGAGDALLAYSSLSMFKSKSIIISSILGSLAAACECEFEGNVAINKDLVLKK